MYTPALHQTFPLDVILFTGEAYWPDAEAARSFMRKVESSLHAAAANAGVTLRVTHGSPETLALVPPEGELAVLLPLSGGTQPRMIAAAQQFKRVAILNGYLPESGFPPEVSHTIMHRNGHPACTDTFAWLQIRRRNPFWLFDLEGLVCLARAFQAVRRLQRARLLKVGETEPWVINSERDPDIFQRRLGTEILPIKREALYAIYDKVDEAGVAALADQWRRRARMLEGLAPADLRKAARVIRAMEILLEKYRADGLSMACFSMIGDIDTTSCLALSHLNETARYIGACEGDLEAGVSQLLLKALGADFVWIGNPIIHADNTVDLVHCTAPTCACGSRLNFSLKRHHESGRGVAPEVALPTDKPVTLVRVGGGLERMNLISGHAASVGAHLPACHTQLKVVMSNMTSEDLLKQLLGTHLVLTYGDFSRELNVAADLLGLRLNGGAVSDQPSPASPSQRPAEAIA